MDNLISMVTRRKNNQYRKNFKQILLKNHKKITNNQYGIDFFQEMTLVIMNLDHEIQIIKWNKQMTKKMNKWKILIMKTVYYLIIKK